MPATRIPTELSGASTCRIVTRGRISGADHAVTVWFAPVDSTVYVAVRNGLRSDWLQNALHDHRVEVGRRNHTWAARAALVNDPAERQHALAGFAAKYARHTSIIRAWQADPPVFVRLEFDA